MNKKSVFGLVLFFASCGPIYQTDYAFTPPKSESGKSCTYQCETVKFQCRQIEDLRMQRCEEQSYWEKQRCENDIYYQKGRDPKWYECGGLSCTADYEHCEGQYRSCYQSCGGKVEAATKCVANCEKVPAQK